jgi:hypothetical protein
MIKLAPTGVFLSPGKFSSQEKFLCADNIMGVRMKSDPIAF